MVSYVPNMGEIEGGHMVDNEMLCSEQNRRMT